MSTVTAAELAARVRCNSRARLDTRTAQKYLVDWRERGIAHEVEPGRWALTLAGRAMFGGWMDELDLEPEEQAA